MSVETEEKLTIVHTYSNNGEHGYPSLPWDWKIFVNITFSLFSWFKLDHENIIYKIYYYYCVVTNLVLHWTCTYASMEIKYVNNGGIIFESRKRKKFKQRKYPAPHHHTS